MNVRGNAVAVVLVVAAIMVVLVVSTQFNTTLVIDPENQSNQKIISETELTIDGALAIATEKFLENGFSSQSKVWYYNTTLVPDINHMDDSYSFLAMSSVSSLLDSLKVAKTEYSISSYDLDVNAYASNLTYLESFDNLNEKEVAFDVNVFTSSADGTKILKAPEEQTIGYPVWGMYKKLYSWVANDPNYFGNVVISAVESLVPSTTSMCSCTNIDSGYFNLNDEKNSCQSKSSSILADINSQLQKEIVNVNNLFLNSQISCEIQITNFDYNCNHIDAIREQQFCITDNDETAALKCISKSKKYDNTTSFVEWADKADPDKAALRSKEIVFFNESDLFAPLPTSPFTQGAIACSVVPGALAKEDVITYNPKVFVEAKIKCTDYSQIVALYDTQENLSSEIVFKVAIKRNVNPSSKLSVTTNLDSKCAGSSFLCKPNPFCIDQGDGCLMYTCYPDTGIIPLTDADGNIITGASQGCLCGDPGVGGGTDDQGGSDGSNPACIPFNSCDVASVGLGLTCVHTPKDCSLDKCSTGVCDIMLSTGCVQKPNINDANACTIDSCQSKTGVISHTPVTCSANDPPCKVVACSEVAIPEQNINPGQCAEVSKIDCSLQADNNFCTIESCDSKQPAGQECVRKNRTCGSSSNLCDKWDCNSEGPTITDGEVGMCQHTVVSCNDNNGCTTDTCNTSTAQCTNTATICTQSSNYLNCGIATCTSTGNSTSRCEINNKIVCYSDPAYAQYDTDETPKECYNWENTCSNGVCVNAPTPKCSKIVFQKCYTRAELAFHPACTVADKLGNCCYSVGQ